MTTMNWLSRCWRGLTAYRERQRHPAAIRLSPQASRAAFGHWVAAFVAGKRVTEFVLATRAVPDVAEIAHYASWSAREGWSSYSLDSPAADVVVLHGLPDDLQDARRLVDRALEELEPGGLFVASIALSPVASSAHLQHIASRLGPSLVVGVFAKSTRTDPQDAGVLLDVDGADAARESYVLARRAETPSR